MIRLGKVKVTNLLNIMLRLDWAIQKQNVELVRNKTFGLVFRKLFFY